MSRRHLRGYRVRPSEGARRGQHWGCAGGTKSLNEGEVTYKFLTETGDMAKGTTQIGEVRRPLAAVSKITKAGQVAFFSQGEDWLLDKRDPVVEEILRLVKLVKKKTKLYEHKGTYRMRAWLLPGNYNGDSRARGESPFGRQGPRP